jgi:hypothetical protein
LDGGDLAKAIRSLPGAGAAVAGVNSASGAEGSKAVALSVELKEGARIEGVVKAHGLNKDTELEWLVLESHSEWPLKSRSPNGQFQNLDDGWSYVVISADEIRTATVAFLDTKK